MMQDKYLVQQGKKKVTTSKPTARKRLPKKPVVGTPDRGSARIPPQYQMRQGQQFETDAEMEARKMEMERKARKGRP